MVFELILAVNSSQVHQANTATYFIDDIVVGFAPHEIPTIPKTWKEIRRHRALLKSSQLRSGTAI